MITKKEILDKINEIIKDEHGIAVTITDKFVDSQLDSLGITIALVMIDDEFPIFDGMTEEESWESLDVPTLTMRDLVIKCKLSIIKASTEANEEMAT